MAFLDIQTIESLTSTLSLFNPVIKLLVIIIEFGCILFFINIKAARFFLIGLICFHIGIFFTSGICFWVWLILDFSFLILLFKNNAIVKSFNFSKTQILLSFLIILFSNKWTPSVTLYWSDVPMTYTYKFEAETASGQKHHLPPGFFAPYDYQFSLSGFSYLNKKPTLPITWGGSDSYTAQWLNKKHTIEQIFDFELSNGKIRYYKKDELALTKFLKVYIKNWNSHQSVKSWLSQISAPRHIWTFPKDICIKEEIIIVKVRIIENTSLFQNGKYTIIRERPVLELDIN